MVVGGGDALQLGKVRVRSLPGLERWKSCMLQGATQQALARSFTHSLSCQPAQPLSCLFFLPHMSSLRHKPQSHRLGSQGA